ncbi:unnamed protein product [Prorocentrum cordatum]|uniref:DUF3987 domain-containing protein n=1 Tax=Prorocentrum cordatum TaxID=2364126 RepID=A0ABN9T5C6_9DINO|nr:unnamed protein product [Polarella glacialis]
MDRRRRPQPLVQADPFEDAFAHAASQEDEAAAAPQAAAEWFAAPEPDNAPLGESVPARKLSRSDMDAACDAMEGVVFPWDEITRLAGAGVEAWLKELHGALQLPMALVFLMIAPLCAFSLHGAQAQCTKMLAVPPLPWLGVVARAGGGKSLAVWFAKQVMMELQNRMNPPDSGAKSDDEAEEGPGADGGAAPETDGAGKRKSTGKDSTRKAKRQKRLIADTGTLDGFFAQMAKNGNRAYVALHEGKPFLSKALAEVADVLQLIEAQFVDISKEKEPGARHHPCFSSRSKLWKIPQDSEFFKTTYNKHAHAQRGAKQCGNDKEASREAKLKTKQRRYATPIDAFLKAVAQKADLDKYRQEQIAAAEGDAVRSVLEGMPIMALRQRVIDKNPAEADQMGLPLWPRSVASEAAEIGYLVSQYLAEENIALVGYLRGGGGAADQKEADDGERIGGLNDEKLAEALQSVDVDKVKRCTAGLLSLPDKVTLASAVKKAVRLACDSRVFDCALTLLSHARLASRVAWKKPGNPGAPASYILLNGEFAEPVRMAQLDAANLLKHFPGASLETFLKQKEDEVSKYVVPLHNAPPVSSSCLAAFTQKWFPLLGAQACPPELEASASQAASPSQMQAPTPPVADAAARLSPEGANRIRAHFRWLICSCTLAEIKKTYVQSRIKGFQAQSEEWQTLLNTFVAMGLAVDTTKGNSNGSFSLRGPGGENVDVVVRGLKSWFTEVQDKEEKAMTKRFQDIAVSKSFNVAPFHEVIAKLGGAPQ